MKTRIKICGVRTVEMAKHCDELGVDYIGLNFVKSSKRKVDPATARSIRVMVSNAKLVGVFADASQEEMMRIAEEVGLDVLQLHGQESPDTVEDLSIPVIKAIGIESTSDIDAAGKYAKADYLLLDTKHDGQTGGTGQSFDLDLIAGHTFTQPIFLAGGVNAGNVLGMIEKVQLYAIDTASGIEENGQQNKEKITELVNIIRNNEK